MNPWLIKGGIVLALVAGVWWASWAIPAHYIAVGVAQATADRLADDTDHLMHDTLAVLAAERKAAAELDAERLKRTARELQHDQTTHSIIDAAVSGDIVLRCPAAEVHPDAPPATATTVAGPGDASGQPIVPAVAGDILGIARDIAKGVRRYNDLLAEHAKALEACKSDPAQP